MSLLNDMLRDLVKQQKVIVAPVVCSHDVLQDTKLFKGTDFNWTPSAIIFVVVFTSVLVFKYSLTGLQLLQHLPLVTAPQQAAKGVSQQANPALDSKATMAKPVAAPVVQPAAEPKVAEVPTTEGQVAPIDKMHAEVAPQTSEKLQGEIADLLVQANRALAQDRLISPVEDNAYSYFQTIASLSPNHPQAQIGLELIAARFLEKAREQLNLGNYQQVEIYSQRANFVAPEYFRQHDFSTAEKLMMQRGLNGNSRLADTTPATTAPLAKSQQLEPQSETIKPFVVAEAASLNVVPNAKWKDEQLANQARELMNQGNVAEALSLLKKFVAEEAKPVNSILALGDVYSQQGNVEALAILVKRATFLSVVDKAKLHAQMLAAQGDDQGAINELEQQLTAANNNEQYCAFLASLYHKTGQYQQSIVSYQRLLNSHEEKPAYWLGLALAFDGLTQSKSALQAYQRLGKFPQLQAKVRDYINQRIAALSNE